MGEVIFVNLVARPGVEPGLEDYALVNLVLPRVSDYIFILKPFGTGAWRLVSTDSPLKGDCLGIDL